MLINMQLSHLLRITCLRLSVNWKPRSEDDLGDKMTNEDFSGFDSDLRLMVSFSELRLELLKKKVA